MFGFMLVAALATAVVTPEPTEAPTPTPTPTIETVQWSYVYDREDDVDYTTSGIHFINNEQVNVDYKLTEEQVNAIQDAIPINVDRDETDYFKDWRGLRNVLDLTIEESYLIQNGILSRYITWDWDGDAEFEVFKDDDPVTKTELYTALYKTQWGPIAGRPVVFDYSSVRSNTMMENPNLDYDAGWVRRSYLTDYWGTSEDVWRITYNYLGNYEREQVNHIELTHYNADFIGDKWVYVSPNVWEIYLAELLNMGLIDRNELRDSTDFYEDYVSYARDGVIPDWLGETPLIAGDEGRLGAGLRWDEDEVREVVPSYFTNESMYTMDALHVVEDFLRLTEKEMTALEAEIVSYKYGVNYIPGITQEDRETLQFLIAKGIINFEDPNEMINLYGDLVWGQLKNVLYRVANPDARYNFSEITLTDSESFWQKQGYYESTLYVQKTDTIPVVETLSMEGEEETEFSLWDWLFGTERAKASSNRYTVVKVFDVEHTYYYNGTEINELESGDFNNEIVSVEFTTYNEERVVRVEFLVSARTEEAAVLYVDSRILLDEGVTGTIQIPTVTRITDGGEEIVLVPASAFGGTLDEIIVLEDKVLQNSVTGSMAVIMDDLDYAIVGNEIIRTEAIMVVDSDDEVYYNLDIISGLLGNGTIKKLLRQDIDALNMYVTSIEEEVWEVVNGTGTSFGSAYVINAGDGYAYCINTFTSNSNTVMRRFAVPDADGIAREVVVILDFQFAVPTAADGVTNLFRDVVTDASQNSATVNEVLYTRPPEECVELRAWWDSNFTVNTVLLNWIFGTTRVDYGLSGYFAPSMTILYDSGLELTDALNQIFQSMNLYSVNGVSSAKYFGGQIAGWWEEYFSGVNYYSDGENATALRAMARRTRVMTVLPLTNTENGLRVYEFPEDDSEVYYQSGGGKVFRQIQGNEFMVGSPSSKELRIYTRETTEPTLEEGDTVFWEGSSYIYVGELFGYYALVPRAAETVEATGTLDNGIDFEVHTRVLNATSDLFYGEDAYLLTGISLVDHYYRRLNEVFGTQSIPVERLQDLFRVFDWQTLPEGLYLDGNTIKEMKDGELTEVDAEEGELYVSPVYYLSKGDWYVEEYGGSYRLGRGSTSAALSAQSIWVSGITDTMVGRIISNYVNLIRLDETVNGQSLLIGDLVWEKDGDVWRTGTLGDVSLIAKLRSLTSTEDVEAVLVEYLFNGMTTQYRGRLYPMTDYVKEIGIANVIGEGTSLGTDGSRIVVRDGETVQDASSYTGTIDGVALYVVLEDVLQARYTSDDNWNLALVYTADDLGNGVMSNLPFYSEELSFEDRQTTSFSMTETTYQESADAQGAKEEFLRLKDAVFRGDLEALFRMAVIAFCSYLTVMSWVCYGILTLGIGKRIAEILAIPVEGAKRHGFDLIKIATFGFYNLDSEPSFARIFVTSVLCFLCNYVALFV